MLESLWVSFHALALECVYAHLLEKTILKSVYLIHPLPVLQFSLFSVGRGEDTFCRAFLCANGTHGHDQTPGCEQREQGAVDWLGLCGLSPP